MIGAAAGYIVIILWYVCIYIFKYIFMHTHTASCGCSQAMCVGVLCGGGSAETHMHFLAAYLKMIL